MNTEGARLIGLHVPDDARYDDIESRTTGMSRRANWLNLERRLADPHCRAVVIWDDSRVLGDEQQVLDIYPALAENSVRLFTKDGREIDVSSPEGLLVGLIMGWKNKQEVVKTRKRVKDTHRSKAGTGRMISRPPFGVRSVPLVEAECGGACHGDLDQCKKIREDLGLDELSRHGELTKKNTVWIINRAEHEQLMLMYSSLNEGVSWGQIEKRLAARGWTKPIRILRRSKTRAGETVGGMPWEKSSIARLIRNTFYRGDFTWNRTEVVRTKDRESRTEKLRLVALPEDQRVTHEHKLGALIDPKLWADANEAADRLYRKKDDAIYPPLLFDDIVFCGRCGWKFVPHQNAYTRRDGTHAYQYYCCGMTSAYSSCSRSHSIAENVLDYFVLGLHSLSQGRRIPNFEVQVTQGRGRVQALLDLDRVDARLKDLDEQEEQTEALFIRRKKSQAWLDEQLARLDADREIALAEKARLLALPVEAPTFGSVPEEVQRVLRLLRDDALPMHVRQKSLRGLVERIVVDRPRIRVILREQTA